MNLVQVIHQRWAADETLRALLPASRVTTGITVDPATPYAVIGQQSNRPIFQCSDGSSVDRVGLRVQVFHESYDAAAAIVDRLKAVFHLAQFPLAGSDKVLAMQRANDSERQQDDGLWQFVVDFDCIVQLATGV